MRIEDTFIMEKNGPHLLFTFTKELLELDWRKDLRLFGGLLSVKTGHKVDTVYLFSMDILNQIIYI